MTTPKRDIEAGVTEGSKILKVPLGYIVVNDEANYADSKRGDIEVLARSIEAVGVKEPLTCRRNKEGQLVLEDGFRRYRAACLVNEWGRVKIERVPVIVEDKKGNEFDEKVLRYASNIHEQATPMSKAKLFQSLIDVGGATVEEASARTGEKPETIKRLMLLLNAAPSVQKAVEKGEVSATAAAALVKKSKGDEGAQVAALEVVKKASVGGKVTSRGVTAATRERKPRSTTRPVRDIIDAIAAIDLHGKENTLAPKLAENDKRWREALQWTLDKNMKAPW
jgi:ParB/RepB/Spo0J family partition protein